MIVELLSLVLSFALVALLAVLAFVLEPLALTLWGILGRLTYYLHRCTRTLLQICCKLKKYTPLPTNTQIPKFPEINTETYKVIHKKLGFYRKPAF